MTRAIFTFSLSLLLCQHDTNLSSLWLTSDQAYSDGSSLCRYRVNWQKLTGENTIFRILITIGLMGLRFLNAVVRKYVGITLDETGLLSELLSPSRAPSTESVLHGGYPGAGSDHRHTG